MRKLTDHVSEEYKGYFFVSALCLSLQRLNNNYFQKHDKNHKN